MKTINLDPYEIELLLKLLKRYSADLELQKVDETNGDLNSKGNKAMIAIKISQVKKLIKKLTS